MKISVCIATYNGSIFLKKQLDSILDQLENDDEVIISDDNSQDDTLNIIESFNDERIKVYKNTTPHSPIFNFENALKHVSGDVVVLADQDDIWEKNKLEVIRKSFEKNANDISLKMYNGVCIDESDKIVEYDLFKIGIKDGLFLNIIKNSFIGCNIAFSAKLLNFVLPFPKKIPMHDSWLGCNAYIYGKVEFIDEKVFQYRIHNNNYSLKNNSLMQKVKWRVNLVSSLIQRYIDVKRTS